MYSRGGRLRSPGQSSEVPERHRRAGKNFYLHPPPNKGNAVAVQKGADTGESDELGFSLSRYCSMGPSQPEESVSLAFVTLVLNFVQPNNKSK